MYQKKSYQQKLDGKLHFFSLLLMFVKLVLLITPSRRIPPQLPQRTRNQRETPRSPTPPSTFPKKKTSPTILVPLPNPEAKRAKNGSKIKKRI
jgi:hypothetical protein